MNKNKTSQQYSSGDCQDNILLGVSHLLGVFGQATPQEIRDGARWYLDAHQDAIVISEETNIPLETVIKVACALSPKCLWQYNMASALWVIEWYQSGGYVPPINDYATGKVYLARTPKSDPNKPCLSEDNRVKSPPYGGLKCNVIKALWILQGHDWVLRGNKVSAFCENIAHPLTSQKVTVDSHAIQVWFGSSLAGTYSVPPSWYAIVANDYIRAATIVNLSPLQFQAVVWLVKKRLSKSAKSKGK